MLTLNHIYKTIFTRAGLVVSLEVTILSNVNLDEQNIIIIVSGRKRRWGKMASYADPWHIPYASITFAFVISTKN